MGGVFGSLEIAMAWDPPEYGPNLTPTSEMTNPPGLSPGQGPLCLPTSCCLDVILSTMGVVWR